MNETQTKEITKNTAKLDFLAYESNTNLPVDARGKIFNSKPMFCPQGRGTASSLWSAIAKINNHWLIVSMHPSSYPCMQEVTTYD